MLFIKYVVSAWRLTGLFITSSLLVSTLGRKVWAGRRFNWSAFFIRKPNLNTNRNLKIRKPGHHVRMLARVDKKKYIHAGLLLCYALWRYVIKMAGKFSAHNRQF